MISFCLLANSATAGFDTQTYKIQSILNHLGYSAGPSDGFWGNKTKEALKQFSVERESQYNGQANDLIIKSLENAFLEKEGEFPLFGSKNVKLKLRMPNRSLPNTENGWDELIKTELHNLDISKANLNVIEWEQYVQATNLGMFVDNYAMSMIKNIDCTSMNYEFSYSPQVETPEPYAWCNYALRTSLPKIGSGVLQSILNYWANQEIEAYAPTYLNSTNSYILQQHFAQLTTTYAIFYNQFSNHEKINQWLINWATKYERVRDKTAPICPFHDPFIIKSHKIKGKKYSNTTSCGSIKWRGSIARIALGLRTGNRDVYLSGVRQLEALLGIFDHKGIYVHYATRGWDSLGYMIDVPNYLADIAILFESIGYDFYQMPTNSGLTVGQLINQTNDFLKNPKKYEQYYLGTPNERPDEQPKFFTDINDYGGYSQWRRERDSSDKEIMLRSFHYQNYKIKKGEKLDDYISMHYNSFTNRRSASGYLIPGENLMFGFTSAVPQILSTLSKETKIWDTMFSDSPKDLLFQAHNYEDARSEIKIEWDNLQKIINYPLEEVSNLSIQNIFNDYLGKQFIDFDVYFVPTDATRGKYGILGKTDRKEPLRVKISQNNKVILREETFISSSKTGDIIGELDDNFIKFSFQGRHCDNCQGKQLVEITFSMPLQFGASTTSDETGQKIILRPLPIPNLESKEIKTVNSDLNHVDLNLFKVNNISYNKKEIDLNTEVTFDVYFAKSVAGHLDQKMPITLKATGSKIELVDDGFLVDNWDTFEGKLLNDNFTIKFEGYACDSCNPGPIIIKGTLSSGTALSSTSGDGYRILLVAQ